MKGFFKYVLATFVGIIISTVLLFLLLMGIIGALISRQDKPVEMKNRTVLYMELDQPIVDREPSMHFDLTTLSKTGKIGLNTILQNIEKAKNDPNIEGIHLSLSFIPAGIATLEEIRNALLDFRESGKFITVYSEMMAQNAYYLASAADKIYFSPAGFMEFVGLRVQSPFFKHALDKLDMEATVIRYGKYKSAAEQFSETGYSAENREQLGQMITTFWNKVCKDISEQRGISTKQLNKVADKLLLASPQQAYELGFVDSLLYEDQVIELLKEQTGTPNNRKLRLISLRDYTRVPAKRVYKGLAKDKIAVVYAGGQILGGEGDEQTIGSKRFVKAIRDARTDSTIKAIVLRVNSPGGSAIASESILRELSLARNVKPVVVSMGNLAASGGYYISCTADTIICQPTTITGSIGVIGLYVNSKGFFNKLGITFDSEKTNTYSDFLSGVRPATGYELNFWQTIVDSTYTTFAHRVGNGRDMTFAQVDAIGQGRVWSGADALELGLVDKLGGLNDAIEVAKNMAGLDEKYRIVELPALEDPFQRIMKDLSQGVQFKILERKLGMHGEYLNACKLLFENQGIMTRMPFDIHVY